MTESEAGITESIYKSNCVQMLDLMSSWTPQQATESQIWEPCVHNNTVFSLPKLNALY